ncbi:hypothetical protein GR247_29405 [Rhizobium leguminosarum]|uniref:Uncharacterized protein n=2 Tax=Rhizobium/Agrobacterium group TaxID=227290 RepID=A0A6P0DRX5_RHILE|nr:hypothetical protein [Rhizobium leguminosarum]NEJ24245.1 hypothetical protein [Rhizobium leguminosarum]NEK54371.1 hypothetical protein [Rhizobium leguminosarum]NKM88173.1 hypothetical protein [Rhizobium laguerreae]
MTMDLIDIVSSLEQNEELHLARLLVLLNAFMKKDASAVEGITKLAKLDFLLRYPSYFEAALEKRGVQRAKLQVSDFERKSIEATMVRYRFGPWDHRYRRFLNNLASRGFVTFKVEGRKISIDLTDSGVSIAETISRQTEFEQLVFRSSMLAKHLDLSATKLMNFIYDTFPELNSMQLNDEIDATGLIGEN